MQPPHPNPNPQFQNPNSAYYHADQYSYYYSNHHLQPPNPNNYPQQTILSHPNDQYYRVVAPANALNPPGVDPNSSSSSPYPPHPYSYGYQVQQPASVAYAQYQAISVESIAVPYNSNPNTGSVTQNWAVNEVTPYATGATLPPNGIHQYVPAESNSVSLLHRTSKVKGISKKATKTKVVQSAWCEVCKVCCDTKEVLDIHKSGKKHLKNLEKLKVVASAPTVAPIPVTVASSGLENTLIGPSENPNKAESTKLGTKVVRSVWCEVCKIGCDTVDVFNVHISGKKHEKNLKKLTGASIPIPDPVAAVVASGNHPVNPGKSVPVRVLKSKKKAVASPEDLETKRRKVLEGGAAAATVRTCATCNIVCNSERVFQHHLQGQKHIAMMKRLASRRISIATGAN